jgi:hypothetical protein
MYDYRNYQVEDRQAYPFVDVHHNLELGIWRHNLVDLYYSTVGWLSSRVERELNELCYSVHTVSTVLVCSVYIGYEGFYCSTVATVR